MPFSPAGARRIWFAVHRYLALTVGLFFALLGLTGSLSLYGDGLDRLFNPALVITPTDSQPQPLDKLLAALRQAYPDDRGAWTLELPRGPDEPLTAWYEKPLDTLDEDYAPRMVAMNPYTGEIVASRFWGRTLRSGLVNLHAQLRLGRGGGTLVGWLGLGLTVSLLTGIVLWWPGRANLRAAFGFRHDAGVHRLALDLHRWLGLLAWPALLVLALSGVHLAWPGLGEALVGSSGMGHDDQGPAIRSTGQPFQNRPVGVEEAVLLARGPFSRSSVRLVTTPDGPEGTFRVTFRQPSEINDRHPMTAVWVDQYRGQIREVRNPARFGPGETLLTAIWPLHTGELLGAWGRLAWFCAGLMLPVLYITGLTRWLIGKGWLRDRLIDYTPLHRAWDLTRARLREWFRRGYPRLETAARRAAAELEARLRGGLRWLNRRISGR